MLNISVESDLNQISLTGVRALALIGLLVIKPRTLEEIKNEFIRIGIMEKTHSDDILRIDLNTIKTMGCKISRADAKTNFKYVLINNPFNILLTKEHAKILKRVYDKIKSNCTPNTLLEYDKLFKKIAEHSYDNDVKEIIQGISALRYYDHDIIVRLVSDCENERLLSILYKSPTTKTESIKNIVAQKLEFKNDKMYLYGYDTDKKRSSMLNINRIKTIISRKTYTEKIESNTIKVKFAIKDFGIDMPLEEENILEIRDSGYIVEGEYFNEFIAKQRILSFGSKCTVLEPLNFKNKIISTLKEMRKIYER